MTVSTASNPSARPAHRSSVHHIESLARRARRRVFLDGILQAQTAPVPVPSPAAWPVKAWRADQRVLPNAVLRGSLFAAIRGERRPVLDDAPIALGGNLVARYSGEGLNQYDGAVWAAVLHSARHVPLGVPVEYQPYRLLSLVSGTRSSKKKQLMMESLDRLAAARLVVSEGAAVCQLRLVDVGPGRVLALDPALGRLHECGWTVFDAPPRQALNAKPLAAWAYGYFAVQHYENAVRFDTLYSLSGSQAQRLRRFKEHLREALVTLQGMGLVESFELGGDRVEVRGVSTEKAVCG